MACLHKGKRGRGKSSQHQLFTMWLVSTCTFLLLLVSVCEGSGASYKKRCGTHLRDAVTLACASSGFYEPSKRADNVDLSRKRPRKPSNSLLQKFKREDSVSKIVDECCRRPCGYDTLTKYCKDDGFLQDTAWLSSLEKLGGSREQSGSIPAPPPQTETETQDIQTIASPDQQNQEEETEVEDDHQPFGSYAYPGKKNYRYVWAVVYDDPQANADNLND